jgi:hypothetical protein
MQFRAQKYLSGLIIFVLSCYKPGKKGKIKIRVVKKISNKNYRRIRWVLKIAVFYEANFKTNKRIKN